MKLGKTWSKFSSFCWGWDGKGDASWGRLKGNTHLAEVKLEDEGTRDLTGV